MPLAPITNITLTLGKAERVTIDILDQYGENIADNISYVISDPTIVAVASQTSEDYHLRALAIGSCTITFSCKGVNKVLNVTVVAPIVTNINIIPHRV